MTRLGVVGLLVLTGAVGVLTLVDRSLPDRLTYVALLVFAWFGLAALWVTLFFYDRYQRRPDRVPVRLWFWLTGPVMAAVVVVLIVADVPARTRFALSESSLERSARAISAGKELPVDDRWIGLYHVSRTDPFDNGTVHFTIDGAGYGFLQTGFAWVPDSGNLRANTAANGFSYEPIRGNWYRWRLVS